MSGVKTGLQLYDTKNKETKAVFISNGAEVRIYCCGPTVYRDAHVGNLRTFLLADLVTRTLNFSGYKTKLIQNITDVGHMNEDVPDEDKMLAQSSKENRDPFEIARDYERKFHQDLALLGVKPAGGYPRASETIDLMIELISKLIEKGNAYVGTDASVYFSAQTFESYGAISGNRLDALKPGHRFEYTDDGAKRFHADWALWKNAGSRTQMVWESPWGAGFPGWHIECSAMSLKLLSGHVDLHIGGIDLRFPHHENERAQSNAADGSEVVDLWLHGEHLLFEGRKMSKSAGNVVLLKDLIAKGIDPLALRLCFLENRYRSQMDLTWDSIKTADSTLAKWRERFSDKSGEIDLEQVATNVAQMALDINLDLDTPRALQKLRKVEKDSTLSPATKHAIALKIDEFIGLELTKVMSKKAVDSNIQELLLARANARTNKDFKLSDELRDKLQSAGIEVKDTPSGQEWNWL